MQIHKTKFSVAVLTVLAALCATAQSREQKAKASETPCVFDVKPLSSKGAQEGYTTRTKSKALSYRAFIRSNAKEEVAFSLEAVYMAVRDKRTLPLSRNEFFFTLAPGCATNLVFESPMLESTEYGRGVAARNTGFKILGAIARLKRDGVVVKNYCSNYAWKKIAWNEKIDVEAESNIAAFSVYERQQLMASRLASCEHVDLSQTKTDVAPSVFLNLRMPEPVRLRGTAYLSMSYYGDFAGCAKTHVCIHFDAIAPTRLVPFHAYARRETPLGLAVLAALKDGKPRPVTVTLHYPRNAESPLACFLDAFEETAADAPAEPAAPAQAAAPKAPEPPAEAKPPASAAFQIEKVEKPTLFTAEVSLAPDARHTATHWCLLVRLPEENLRTPLPAYLEKDGEAGGRVSGLLKDGRFHKGQALLWYSPKTAGAVVDDFVPDSAGLGGTPVL